ncbi:MAG TPA: hypothetical protein VJS92_10345, partial [Candidatus Polarisedimenticolaceae bacterium]|nr:hypothetical protein [Candidatus Polarisedimenticolaceae bacterium]
MALELPIDAAEVARLSARRPLLEGAPLRRVDRSCFELELTAIAPERVIWGWEHGLRDPLSPVHWLLDVVEGSGALTSAGDEHVAGLSVAGARTLRICVDSRGEADLPARLTHPALWPEEPLAGATRIELLQAEAGEAATLWRAGRVEAAVDYGLDVEGESIRLEDWDRVYALWIGTAPAPLDREQVRRQLAESIDREAVAGVFEGAAEPA